MYCYFNNLFRCLQGINKSELTMIMLNVSGVRKQACRNLRERQITKLSPNAQRALQAKMLSNSFWRRWGAKYQSIGTVSINRVLNCTKEMACNHLNELAEELIECNIFTIMMKPPSL